MRDIWTDQQWGWTVQATNSRENFFNHFSGDIGQAKASAVIFVNQPFVIEPQQVQNRGMNIVN
jgi:hypothetical protein